MGIFLIMVIYPNSILMMLLLLTPLTPLTYPLFDNTAITWTTYWWGRYLCHRRAGWLVINIAHSPPFFCCLASHVSRLHPHKHLASHDFSLVIFFLVSAIYIYPLPSRCLSGSVCRWKWSVSEMCRDEKWKGSYLCGNDR